jgi:2-hydroxychromene-2-carboxylate isomerase
VRAVRFYFDYVSPNAYLAWSELPRIAERRGVAVEPVPVLFAGLLEAHGQLGPAEVPAKMRWMWRNNLRKAAGLGIALEPPAFHPFNPLLALRVSSLPLEPPARTGLVDAIFRAVWARSLHVSDPAVVTTLADELGLDGTALVAAAGHEDAKARVRRQTDDAIGRGVFGVPTMEIGSELFWGYDDLPHLERFLEGTDPVDAERWRAWSTGLRPSAIREPRSKK